ncbi:hypothetical protein AAY473_026935 [Plecturocebus cupreus]
MKWRRGAGIHIGKGDGGGDTVELQVNGGGSNQGGLGPRLGSSPEDGGERTLSELSSGWGRIQQRWVRRAPRVRAGAETRDRAGRARCEARSGSGAEHSPGRRQQQERGLALAGAATGRKFAIPKSGTGPDAGQVAAAARRAEAPAPPGGGCRKGAAEQRGAGGRADAGPGAGSCRRRRRRRRLFAAPPPAPPPRTPPAPRTASYLRAAAAAPGSKSRCCILLGLRAPPPLPPNPVPLAAPAAARSARRAERDAAPARAEPGRGRAPGRARGAAGEGAGGGGDARRLLLKGEQRQPSRARPPPPSLEPQAPAREKPWFHEVRDLVHLFTAGARGTQHQIQGLKVNEPWQPFQTARDDSTIPCTHTLRLVDMQEAEAPKKSCSQLPAMGGGFPPEDHHNLKHPPPPAPPWCFHLCFHQDFPKSKGSSHGTVAELTELQNEGLWAVSRKNLLAIRAQMIPKVIPKGMTNGEREGA